MNAIRTFRDLVAWQRAMSLAELTYQNILRLPNEERFELTKQLRRCAISIPSNIAEGFGRQSHADFLKFLRIARGSLNELSTQYELAVRLQLLESNPEMLEMIEEVDRVLQGLINSVQERLKQSTNPPKTR